MLEVYRQSHGLSRRFGRLATRFLIRRNHVVRPQRGIVTFTFDDFPATAATQGARRIESYGWRATYFAVSGFEGKANHHGPMFTRDNLLRLAANGHEIGCHTADHASATHSDSFAGSCQRNAEYFASVGIDTPPETFAFPYGEVTVTKKLQVTSRFRAMRGARSGINRGVVDLNHLHAIPLYGGEAGLAEALEAIRDAARNPGWIIFLGHEIDDNPSEWGCDARFLEACCAAAAESSCDVLTMSAALDRIGAPARDAPCRITS